MKKWTRKGIALGLSAALVLGGAGAAFALSETKNEEKTETETIETKQAEGADAAAGTPSETEKDETVYVLAQADGTVEKIIVSDWLENKMEEASLSDTSDLTNIKNSKGDESYTVSGEGKVWDAQGNDVYYQGEIEKELPVGLSVSYRLDGKTISPEDLAGKSGKVTIRFDYDNQQYQLTKINGVEEKIYVPFAMLTGMLLDNDNFRNVTVTNGKLINDGDRTAVIGIAFPGLQEDLGLSPSKIDIPGYVEIQADVTDFTFGMTVTIATNEVFSEIDTENLNSAEDLTASMGKLTDAMDQLMDGSSALYDGLCTLLEKSGSLVDGINQLAEGAAALKDGALSVDEGAAQLQSGAIELSQGLDTLASNNDTINGGAKQVFNTLLSTAETQIKAAGLSVPTLTIENYEKVLNQLIDSLDASKVYDKALKKVEAGVDANEAVITEKVTEAVQARVQAQVTEVAKAQVEAAVTSAVKKQVEDGVISTATSGQITSKEGYDAAVEAGLITEEQQQAIEGEIETQMASPEIQEKIEKAIDEQMESDETQKAIADNTEAQMGTDEVKQTVAENVKLQKQKAVSENMASDAVQSQLKAASDGAQSLISLKASLDSYNSFYLGLLSYTSGVASAAEGAAQLSDGAGQLKDGTAQLKAGATELYDGILQLKDGAPALVDGVTQLKDGSMALSDGLKQLNEEGIEKIVDLVDGDLEGSLDRLKAVVEVSKSYRNFSGISDDVDGQVRFIYRTEEIK